MRERASASGLRPAPGLPSRRGHCRLAGGCDRV